MGPLYKKYISSGINQNSEVPGNNAAGESQYDVMMRRGKAFKEAKTNLNTFRDKLKGFQFNEKTLKQFQGVDSTNVSNFNNALKGYNTSNDSINKVNENYMNSILPSDSSNKMLEPESGTPLLQGAYERGDAYVEDYAGNALMQGLQTLGDNVARQFNDPMNKSRRQKNRVDRRNKRADKKFPDEIENMSKEELAKLSNFTKKTEEIDARSIANEKKANIDSRYKEWLISNKRNKNLENLLDPLDTKNNEVIVQKPQTAKQIAAAKKSRDEYEASLKDES